VGLVVGTPTWGKGLVQTVYNLSYGSGIALTTAKYYTPSGRLIQRDYSSYYDYYNEFEDGDEDGDEGGGGEFATDLGRKVYGGGGITPDVIVELPDGPLILQSLFVHNAFFNFAVDYNNRHPVPDESWQPEEGILEEFREWLISEEIASAEELDELFADPEAATYTRRQIHADLFTAAFGPEASHRVLARGDLQIRKALELLDQARDLLAERRELSGSEESGRFSSPFEERMLEQHRVVQPKDDGRPD
jgi:carboxyl-terminal processing protease